MTLAPVITIDGPSGSGKGTITSRLAQHLGWWILDSGLLYRALGWATLHTQISPTDHSALSTLLSQLGIDLSARGHQISWQEQDITPLLRTESCSAMASTLGADPYVRTLLLDLQRQCRHAPGLIADGRDMGTVVFPDANLKIFLQADSEQRAWRRYQQLKQQHIDVTLETVAKELALRDARDEQRAIAPLKPAKDAILIDTTHLSIEAVVAIMLDKTQLFI